MIRSLQSRQVNESRPKQASVLYSIASCHAKKQQCNIFLSVSQWFLFTRLLCRVVLLCYIVGVWLYNADTRNMIPNCEERYFANCELNLNLNLYLILQSLTNPLKHSCRDIILIQFKSLKQLLKYGLVKFCQVTDSSWE